MCGDDEEDKSNLDTDKNIPANRLVYQEPAQVDVWLLKFEKVTKSDLDESSLTIVDDEYLRGAYRKQENKQKNDSEINTVRSQTGRFRWLS